MLFDYVMIQGRVWQVIFTAEISVECSGLLNSLSMVWLPQIREYFQQKQSHLVELKKAVIYYIASYQFRRGLGGLSYVRIYFTWDIVS